MNNLDTSTWKRGLEGEKRAQDYLVQCGYTILAHNWRTSRGEIDIIAQRGTLLVFCEVKTLKKGSVDTLEFILGKIKQKKIIETAKRFLLDNRQYKESYIRFDVLVVDMPGFPAMYHIEDAFSENI